MIKDLVILGGGSAGFIAAITLKKKLPELTKNAARAMKEFEKARHGDDDETPPQVAPAPVQPQAAQAAPAQPAPAQPTQPVTDGQPARPTDVEGGTAQ